MCSGLRVTDWSCHVHVSSPYATAREVTFWTIHQWDMTSFISLKLHFLSIVSLHFSPSHWGNTEMQSNQTVKVILRETEHHHCWISCQAALTGEHIQMEFNSAHIFLFIHMHMIWYLWPRRKGSCLRETVTSAAQHCFLSVTCLTNSIYCILCPAQRHRSNFN